MELQKADYKDSNIRLFLPRGPLRWMVLAFILIIGALFFKTTPAFAADGAPEQIELKTDGETEHEKTELSDDAESEQEETEQNAETATKGQSKVLLTVKEVWLNGDTLNIKVIDSIGEEQTLQLSLSDYAQPEDEYVTVQATDSKGNTSNMIQFRNPYYTEDAEPSAENGVTGANDIGSKNGESVSGVQENANPFTPDGSGTIVDDAGEDEGKEFFTVDTPDGNTFYLIVDRQRGGENVYLLNAVNENDLASLAKPGDGTSVSAIETPVPTATATPEITATPEPTPAPEKENNMGTIIFIAIATVVAGGIAYYVKIVRPKKNAEDEYASDGFDDDTEADLDSGEEGEEE